jgi:predicted transcriptional regulator
MAKQKFSDIELVSAWGRHNGNESQVARELGVTRAAVRKRREGLPKALFATNVETFRQTRADAFAEIQRLAITYLLDGNKLKKASPQQLTTVLGIAYDKERLEKNLSTENIAHNHYQQLDDKSMESVKKLAAELTAKKLKEIEYDS